MIALGYITHGQVYQEFVASMLRLLFSGLPITNVFSYSCAYVAKGRCEVVKQFLGGKDEWLLWLDHDIVVEPDAIRAMLALSDRFPIVSGMYVNQHTVAGHGLHDLPLFYVRDDQNEFMYVTKLPEGPFHISGSGMGLTLIHRSVFEKMAQEYADDPWPWYGHDVHAGERLGEDLTFFLRAHKCGFKAVGVPEAQAKHYKVRPLTAADISRAF